MSGWIKLHRQMLEWEWYDDANVKCLFIHLLLKANHKTNTWRGVEVKAGTLVTGRQSLAVDLKLTEQQIRTALNKLQSSGEITIKATNKYSVITITCWESYQQDNQQGTQQTTNKQPTNNHKQECKNERMKEKTSKPRKRDGKRDDVPYEQIVEAYNTNLDDLPYVEHLTEQRIRSINGRWDWVKKNGKRRQGVDFFNSYFDYVKGSDFLMGRKTDFKVSFDWLMKAQNFIKIIEGTYHHD